MKRITSLLCLMICFTVSLSAQTTSIEKLLTRFDNLGIQKVNDTSIFTAEERKLLDNHFNLKNNNNIANNPVGSGTCSGSTIPHYSNSDNGDIGGVTSQQYEQDQYAIFDCQSADDFVILGEIDGIICQIDIYGDSPQAGFPSDPNSEVIMYIYDDNAGLPGELLYTESFSAPELDPDNTGSFTINPTESPLLTSGVTYWLSIQAKLNVSLGGQWYWNSSHDENGYGYAWQNPPGGFPNGCTTWTDGAPCIGGGSGFTGPDMAMDIIFQEPDLGTNENIFEGFSYYPNPSFGTLNLSSVNNMENVVIYNLIGQQILSQNINALSTTLTVSSLTTGTYLMKVTINGQEAVYKIVKN